MDARSFHFGKIMALEAMFFMRPAAIWASEVSSGLFVIHVLDISVVIPIELRITTGVLTVFR